jgi:myo-inositol 2-dehydrogenase/D-chiro-inositol 1-dehydrogenase
MNFLIVGDGPDERAWAETIRGDVAHRVVALVPGFGADEPDLPKPSRDLDEALATDGLDAAIVGGPVEGRAETLRRCAAEGLAIVCRHPPGDDSEAYYQVALSRAETGSVIVPDLPARLHPEAVALRDRMAGGTLGGFRSLLYERSINVRDEDLAPHAFARAVDLARSVVGEIEAVNATGDPAGDHPVESLVVQLRAVGGRRAEVRLTADLARRERLVLTGAHAVVTIEWPAGVDGPGRRVVREGDGPEEATSFEAWDARGTILAVLASRRAGGDAHPDLADATRATEVAEAVVRSLRRGRTIELHYEEISEAATFKGVMTSLGCLVLLGSLAVVPLALAGPALGLPWLLYLAYAVPPVLVGFALVQVLRFAIRDPSGHEPPSLPGSD